ncbi:PH domain-containing protein [Saccharopolyspora sp. MS10]|uniref:PH domain-containing protein n=1 Tax=Saccharopolyspora sp. MS10 TaxID=3385973 RepID=UPI0039A2A161
MSEHPPESGGRPEDRDADPAVSERADAEGTRDVSTGEENGSTGTATREEPGDAAGADAAGSPAPETAAPAPAGAPGAAGRAKELPKSLTFRLTRTALLAVLGVAIGVTPIAFAQPFPLLLPTYLLPAALTFAIVRPQTSVTAERITARGLFRRRSFGWDELASIRLDEKRWARAVLVSGAEVVLPAIRVRDVPRLAELSGGRLPDPKAAPAPERAEDTGSPERAEDAAAPAEGDPAARDGSEDAAAGESPDEPGQDGGTARPES